MAPQNITFADFQKGLLNSGQNAFDFPEGGLKEGQNLDLADGGLKTRPGSSISSTGSLPDGEVMAMCQFRSPTTEQSYIVAEVRSIIGFEAGSVPGGSVATSIVVWATGDGVALCIGDTGMANVWQYDPTLDSWTDLAAPGGGTPHDRSPNFAVYVPSLDSVIMFGGWYFDGIDNYLNDTWLYNCTANTWAEQTPTGDIPAVGIYTGALRTSNNTIILFNGASAYYELNLDTWVFTEVATTVDDAGFHFPDGYEAIVYDSVNDTLLTAGGTRGVGLYTNATWKLDFSTAHWTRMTDVPSGFDGIVDFRGFYCSGLFHILGLPGAVPPLGGFSYTIATDTWSTLPLEGTPPTSATAACLSDSGTILLWDGTQFYQSGAICGSTAPTVCTLYASPTHLPTTSGVFTAIYEIGQDAGVCTFAPLNDRLVITEGVSDVPLVWGGAMDAAGTDWMHLLHCLIAQDGVRFYDVSAEVCDKDSDTVAQIGGIRRWGWIAFCTDMPTVTGFYIDIETPNTGADGTTTSTFYEPVVIDAAADVERQDLRATITNWVQNAGATGHFTDGAMTVTLGPGNTNEDFVPGLSIKFADAELIIVSIVGDGSGAGSVTLSAAHVTDGVDAAYGTTVDTTGLSVVYQTNAATSAWSQVMGTYPTTTAGYSIRQVIPASAITTSGDHAQLTLQASLGAYGLYPNTGFAANHVSIVERSGTTANGTTTPTEVLFGGSSGCSTSTASEEVTSDLFPFAVDETKDYLVIIDVAWATVERSAPYSGTPIRAGWLAKYSGGTCYTKDPGWGEEEVSYNLQTVSGFTARTGTYGVNEILVATLEAVPSNVYVAHTTDGIQVLTGAWEELQAITVDAVTPGASLLYLTISQDARATFWVFTSSAWRQIVRENAGAWEYNDSATAAPNWVAAAVDSLLGALREAFTVAQNQMTITEIEAITSAQWQGTNGFVPHVSTSLDFAVAMTADGTDVPRLSGLTIQYSDIGQAIMQVWKSGAWTDVPGEWTDGTIDNGNRLGQSGIIGGTTEETADYYTLDGVPGYWWRLLTNGTSPSCAITRVRYQAPCQPLANIGDGQPDIASGVIYVDTSTGGIHDISTEMADNTLTEMASALIPMNTDDYLYVGYLTEFTEIEVTPFIDSISTIMTNNQAASVLSGEYWNGEAWTALTIVDGTIAVTGKTLSGKGKISWTLPTDWKTSIPFDAFFSRGYWVRFSVSVALTATSALSELRVYGVPDSLAKHKFVTAYSNRIALGNTLRAANQIDISRPYEEYGFTGPQAGSFVVGAQDSIVAALSAWDGLLIYKTATAHFLREGASQFESVEAARNVPINTQCVVKAPISGLDSGDRYGLFFLNRYGTWFASGLHTDSIYNTSRGRTISDVLNFWDTTSTPRLDLDYLHLACGEYWPVRNWICWSVPMIFSGSGPQASNNAMIVYDLTLQAWLPPFVFPFGIASICTAYHYNANAQQKLGDLGLYAGDYEGQVWRLFGPGTTQDGTTDITSYAVWGYLPHGEPDIEKVIRSARAYGRTDGQAVKLTIDGLILLRNEQREITHAVDFTRLGNDEHGIDYQDRGMDGTDRGQFLEYRVDFDAYTELLMLQVGVDGLREESGV